MSLLRVLVTAATVLQLLFACTPAMPMESDWALYKTRFVRPEGRVVDTGNGGISHTEGQGMTMLVAVHLNDRETFDAVWQWSRLHLQVRDDKLLAWRWTPTEGVTDKNNASDADLFVAWALLLAHRQWKHPPYLAQAKELIQAIREKLLRKTNRGIVLLPGAVGFDKPEGITVNLSYWIFPAIDEISKVDASPEWQELKRTGIDLLREGRFGRWGLHSDWTLLGAKLTPAQVPRFSYDAVRIPLYLVWGGLENTGLLIPYKDFWLYFKGASFLPAWTQLSDDSIDSYNASLGIRSIAQVTLAYPDISLQQLSALDAAQDYYSSVLLLLTKVALRERGK